LFFLYDLLARDFFNPLFNYRICQAFGFDNISWFVKLTAEHGSSGDILPDKPGRVLSVPNNIIAKQYIFKCTDFINFNKQ
jgi:hypothetical protein